MVVARNERAQTHLVRQLQARSMGREYVALAHGWIANGGRVERAIGRDSRVPIRMSVERPVAPKPAITNSAPARRGQVDPGGRVTEVVTWGIRWPVTTSTAIRSSISGFVSRSG
ncbi:hypothetical protein G6F60_015019 [Rhizopus arrhizus]|nr:hypothetical protein G6F60_015019 [Rhizopus arrhizus]